MLQKIIEESVKEILIGKHANKQNVGSNLDQRFVGEKVIVRTYSAGVHFGTLDEKSGQQAILKDSRRVFYWTHACSLSQLATDGSSKIDDCKISVSVPEILLDQVIEVIPMSGNSVSNLYGAKEWKK